MKVENRKMIYLDDAIDALERKKYKKVKGDIGGLFYNEIIQNDIDALMQLPSVQADLITKMQNGIKVTDANDVYSCGIRNGMRWCLSLIDSKDHLYENFPSAQPEIIYCKDCIHRPIIDDPGAKDGFGLLFPDFRCPCRCDDPYYSWMPNDNWFCSNGEKEVEENE